MRFLRRLRHWARFTSRQDDIRHEVDFHKAMIERELLDRGYTPDEARDEARRRMGNDTMMREDARAVWVAPRVEAVLQDVKYALRAMRRTPALSAGIMITFALGIGTYAAAFSLIDRLMFRPPALMKDAGAVNRVRMYLTSANRDERETYMSYVRYTDMLGGMMKFSGG